MIKLKFLTLSIQFRGKWKTKTDVIPVALKCMLSKELSLESEGVQVFINLIIKPST